MFRFLTIALICMASSLSAGAGPKTDNHVKVALLPVKQGSASKGRTYPMTSWQTQSLWSSRGPAISSWSSPANSRKLFQDQLVEDALFELLVTDRLSETLRTLDAFDTETADTNPTYRRPSDSASSISPRQRWKPLETG